MTVASGMLLILLTGMNLSVMHSYVAFGLPWYVLDCLKMMRWISRKLHNVLELWNKLTFVLSHMPLRLDLPLLLLLWLKMCLLILSLLLLLLKMCSLIPLILVWSVLSFLFMTGVTIVEGNVTLRMIAVTVLPAIRYVATVANLAILPKFAVLLNRHLHVLPRLL